MFKRDELIDDIQTYLGTMQHKIHYANSIGKLDINKNAEHFFSKLLNMVYGLDLIRLDEIKVNYPAIDLGDVNAGVCYQITSTSDLGKIRHTLDLFKSKELYKTYNSIKILILGNKRSQTKNLAYDEFEFSYQEDVFDIKDLSDAIAKKETAELDSILNLFRTDYDNRIIDILKQVKEDKEYYFPRRLHSDKYSTNYSYGLGRVRIDAFLTKSLDERSSCCLFFQQAGVSDCMISFGEESMEDTLFYLSDKGFSEDRKFIWYIDEGKVGMSFANNRFITDVETAQQLCDIIDDLYESYIENKKQIRTIVGANHFMESDKGEFLMLRLPKQIWIAMVDFAQCHDHYYGDTEWDIFYPLNLFVKNHIIIYKNHLDKFDADVLAELCVHDMNSSYVDVVWKPGHSPMIYKMDGFDDRIKWKVQYTHDWILEKFIPYIYYSDLNNKRNLWDVLLRKAMSFETFAKMFDYRDFGIESAYCTVNK